MSKASTKKKDPAQTERERRNAKKRLEDRRVMTRNYLIIAVFVIAALVFGVWQTGLYLPCVTSLTADGERINAVTFNYYYRDCYDSFRNAYGDMLDAYGTIDSDTPLNMQDYSAEMSWGEFFYDTALQNAERNLTLWLEAKEAGRVLSEDGEADVESQLESLRAGAKSNRFVTAGAFLRSHYGKGCTMKSYENYLLMNALAEEYSSEYLDSVTLNAVNEEAWFAESYPDAGDTYDYNTVDFRLVYLPYSGYEYDPATGGYGFSEETREATLSQLRIAATEYEESDQSEEAFAAVAEKYSSYLADEGGLYEQAYKDDENVESQVRTWLFKTGHKSGETDYIEADSGVYLVYFVGENIPAWEKLAQNGLRNEAWNLWYEELLAGTDFQVSPNILNHLYYEP